MRAQIHITSNEYDNAYNTAFEYIAREYKDAFEDCGGIDSWAGDVLGDFLDKFLATLNIYEIDEDN